MPVIIHSKTAGSWVAWSISVAPAADTSRPRDKARSLPGQRVLSARRDRRWNNINIASSAEGTAARKDGLES